MRTGLRSCTGREAEREGLQRPTPTDTASPVSGTATPSRVSPDVVALSLRRRCGGPALNYDCSLAGCHGGIGQFRCSQSSQSHRWAGPQWQFTTLVLNNFRSNEGLAFKVRGHSNQTEATRCSHPAQ
jgi:hypothetical protein